MSDQRIGWQDSGPVVVVSDPVGGLRVSRPGHGQRGDHCQQAGEVREEQTSGFHGDFGLGVSGLKRDRKHLADELDSNAALIERHSLVRLRMFQANPTDLYR